MGDFRSCFSKSLVRLATVLAGEGMGCRDVRLSTAKEHGLGLAPDTTMTGAVSVSGLIVGVEVFFFLGGASGNGAAGGPITVTELPGLVTTTEEEEVGLMALVGVVRGLVLDTMSGGGGLTSVTLDL